MTIASSIGIHALIIRKVILMSDNEPNTPNPLRDGARQMAHGAGQVASELKTRFNNDAAPAAKRAVTTARTRFDSERDTAGGLLPLTKRRAPLLTTLAAALMLIGLILPVAKHGGHWVTYLTMPHSDGFVVIALLLLTTGLALGRTRKPRSHALLRWATGVVATVVCIGGLAASVPNIGSHGLTPGIIVIGLGSLAVGIMAIINVIDKTDVADRN